MKKRVFSALCLGLLVAQTACQPSITTERLLPSPMSASAFEAHIAYLADDARGGRDPGTPGCEAAEDYIMEALRSAGLDAVEDQRFEFVAGSRLGSGNALQVGEVAVSSDDFVPLAFSSAGKAESEAVFIGYGIQAPDLKHVDYKGVEVKNRIVVVLTGSPDSHPHGPFGHYASVRAKTLSAIEEGARALVLLVTEDHHGAETLPVFRGEAVSRDVGIPVVAVRASAVAGNLGIDVASSQEALTRHDSVSRVLNVSVSYDIRVSLERRSTRNVLGWLEARSPERVDELVVVGGHHDHLGLGGPGSLAHHSLGEIHNGADDNASGIAGVIELARALAPRADKLTRHVLFMTFSAEERGLLGSKYFRDNPILRLPASVRGTEVAVKPVAMVNLDMVGRLRDNKVVASGMATSPDWPDFIAKVRSSGGHTLEVQGESQHDLTGSSDHTTFYSMGMPVLFFFTGGHSDYHKPTDDLYRITDDGKKELLINLAGMERVFAFVSDVVYELSTLETLPSYKEGVELTPRMHFKVVLRLMPDYGADVEGMRVAQVSPGGPADLAGIQDGDVITRFGETPVRSVRDYMVGLQKAKAGDKVKVVVRRGEEEKEVEVLPMAMKH